MATAAQLAARRRLVAAATKRHPPRPMPPAQLPRPTAYTRALTSIAEELNQEIHAALADEGLPAPRTDAADGDASIPVFNREGLLARLRRIAEAVVKRRGGFLSTAIQACAANVSSVSRAEWAKQAKAAVGIDLSKIEPNLVPTIHAFRRANLDLITTMARDKVERVKAILEDAPNARVETIRDRILEEGNVTKRQAALIARDQVLSLNAQVTEKRHAAAGVEKYTWRTSGDGDVRPAHRALNGKVFAYADPPVVDAKKGRRENPGQDYQCRCTAEPVIDWGEEESAARADSEWDPAEHPKDKANGQFTEKSGGGSGASSMKPPKDVAGGPPATQPTSGSREGEHDDDPHREKRRALEASLKRPLSPAERGHLKAAIEKGVGEPRDGEIRSPEVLEGELLRYVDRARPSSAPNPDAVPRGEPERIHTNMDSEQKRATKRQHEAADLLARAGFDVEHRPKGGGELNPLASPDYRIEGRKFDCYAPGTPKTMRGLANATYSKKIKTGQTARVVLHLGDCPVDPADFEKYVRQHPITGLKELIVVTHDGRILHLNF